MLCVHSAYMIPLHGNRPYAISAFLDKQNSSAQNGTNLSSFRKEAFPGASLFKIQTSSTLYVCARARGPA